MIDDEAGGVDRRSILRLTTGAVAGAAVGAGASSGFRLGLETARWTRQDVREPPIAAAS